MKLFIHILMVCGAALEAFGQSFQPWPGPLLEKEVAFQQANECYIFFDNLSGDTLQLRWRRIEASVPGGWKIDLCDYGLCYVGVPDNGTMSPVADTVRAYLKLIVQPDTVPGSAWLHFRVFEKGHEDNKNEVFFSLFTPGTTSAAAPGNQNIRIFPNPASTFLCLENGDTSSKKVSLTDASGRSVLVRTLPPAGPSCIDLPALPDGVYYLRSDRKVQKISIQQ